MYIGIMKTNMSLMQRSFYLLNVRSMFAIFLRNLTQCVGGFSLLLQKYARKGDAVENPATLGFFFVTEKSQSNAMHAQLL